MKLVVAGVTGRVGSVVAQRLLERGHSLRVIVRDAARGEALRARAELAVGRLDDADFLGGALAGADGAFLLLPSDYPEREVYGRQKRLAEAMGRAVLASRVAHVTLLSSVGAQHPSGTGPVQGLFQAENHLRAASVPRTFVRAGSFMDDLAGVLAAARDSGIYPSFLPPEVRAPWVAARDVGELAAAALEDPPRTAVPEHIYDLAGPRDYTPADIAAALGQLFGRDVKPVDIPPGAARVALEQSGLPPHLAEMLADMYAGAAKGLLNFGQGERRRGKVELADALRALAAPLG